MTQAVVQALAEVFRRHGGQNPDAAALEALDAMQEATPAMARAGLAEFLLSGDGYKAWGAMIEAARTGGSPNADGTETVNPSVNRL